MTAEAAAHAALPEIIPVFPLPGVLLLPRGRLPLNIFEPRYVAMVDDALCAPQRVIGMIQPLDGGSGEPSALYPIGCLGRITSFTENEGGRFRYLITLTGMCRFTIREELEGRRGYRRVRADYGKWNGDFDARGVEGVDRPQLLETLKRYFTVNEISADWDTIADTPDDRLITTLAMVCPFSANEKQALLEAADPKARAKTLMALMEMASMQRGDGDEQHKH